jgi:NitT/TauT family transport system ATP-binding protein
MCDRVLVFSTNPGRVVGEIAIDLPQQRDRLDPAFRDLVERIYVEMTAGPASAQRPIGRRDRLPGMDIGAILPDVSTNHLSGLVDALAAPPYSGSADLPVIASALHMEVDDLFPVAETLQMLRFARIEDGDIRLSEEGRRFAQSTADERKRLFARHLLANVPLAAHIRRVLDERAGHKAPKSRFRDELEDAMTPQAAERTLGTAISWGRYAETYAYDASAEILSLENP